MNAAVQTPAPTPQRERRVRTRSAVLRAAGRVFAERGYHGATLDDVVAEAGLSKGALYHYFPSKQDLFLALLEERLGAGISDVEAVIAEGRTEQDQMELAGEGFLRRVARDPRWLPLLLEFLAYGCRNERGREGVAKHFIRPAREAVVALIHARPPRQLSQATISLDEFAVASAALINGLAIERAFESDGVPDDLAGRCLALLSAGMRQGKATSSSRPRRRPGPRTTS